MDLVVVGAISFVISLIAGVVGLGGAVLFIPAYMYIPTLFGIDPMGMKAISGMTSAQVFASSILSAAVHHSKGAVDKRLVLTMALPIAGTSWIGAMLSGSMDAEKIQVVFAILAIAGSLMITFGNGETNGKDAFNVPRAVSIAGAVGVFGGIAGAPGSFVISPLMMSVLRIPTRITIGSTLGIVIASAGAATLGKAMSGQVPVHETAIAVVSSLPGALLGSTLSHQLSILLLRRILAAIVGFAGLYMLYSTIVP